MKSIKFLYPHTHDGKPYDAGVTIDIADHWAEWLVARGIGEIVNDSAPAAAAAALHNSASADLLAGHTSTDTTGDHDEH